jgi:hypothetical protein
MVNSAYSPKSYDARECRVMQKHIEPMELFSSILDIMTSGLRPDEVFEQVVHQIPSAFSGTGSTSVMLAWDSHVFKSREFADNGEMISSEIMVNSLKAGNIEVYRNYPRVEISGIDADLPGYDDRVTLDRIAMLIGKGLEKRHMLESAQRSEHALISILDNMEDQVFICEHSGKPAYANKAVVRHLGYSEEELLSMPAASLVSDSDKEMLQVIAEKIARDKKTVFEITLSRKNGSEIPVEASAKLIMHEGREVLLCVAREITKRKEADHELQRCVEDLKESNGLKELFTDIIRHDLLTPAGIVLGFTEELQRRSCDEDTAFALRRIHENTRKLIGLLDSATKLSKLQKIDEIVFERIDIVPLFRSSVENFRTDIEEKNHSVELDATAVCIAMANPILEEVFTNLLSNAVKYSPPGSRIVIDFLDSNDAWKVTVRDYGHGVLDTDKPYLFNRFQRADKKGIRGTGLGLAIVKRIIELHGGMYGVEDNPEGEGSIFWVVVGKA